jgi:hypothetical protein
MRTLALRISSAADPAETFVAAFPLSLEPLMNGALAYVGFASAGGDGARQEILNFRYRVLDAPTRVTGVFVNGPDLTNRVVWRLAAGADLAFGYPIPDRARQLRPVPWIHDVSKVSIRFDHDVASVLDQGDLQVRGPAGAIATTGFAYDAPTKTGTWTLGSPVTADKLRLVLDDAGFGGIVLDGQWTNPSAATPAGDTYPSGDGSAGNDGTVSSDFDFRINVLRGDANGDQVVSALDLADIKKRLGRRPTGESPGTPNDYTIFADLNADGVINAIDVAAVKFRLTTRINIRPEPAAPATPVAQRVSDGSATALLRSDPNSAAPVGYSDNV